MANKKQGSIFIAFLWMLFLSILLFWIPVFGQFIAGLVGGKKAGGAGRAIIAFLLPAIIFTLLFICAFPLVPIIGISSSLLLIMSNFTLFCGAIVGGALS